MQVPNSILLLLFWVLCFCANNIVGKECTNHPTELSSHTFRHELLSSTNESWKAEMLSDHHLIPTDDSAWQNLLPRKGEELDWAMMYRKIKNDKGRAGHKFLKEVSLHDVRLDPDSIHGQAQLTNLEYLLMLDVDRLIWNFRKTAGLPTPGLPYGGWEQPKKELCGHFVGHYLSASAQMWAGTHNGTLHQKMSAVVSSLYKCQKQMGIGYLSAFPAKFFDRFEAIKSVWAPYYTIHKILAGLLDQYLFASNSQALQMVVWMVDYFRNRVQNVISKYTVERHWLSLNEETGGMNDVLYKLFSITVDSLSGFHANTHIPIVIGSQMRYEVTGDPLYKTTAQSMLLYMQFFMVPIFLLG